jgi:hypothetical protein
MNKIPPLWQRLFFSEVVENTGESSFGEAQALIYRSHPLHLNADAL